MASSAGSRSRVCTASLKDASSAAGSSAFPRRSAPGEDKLVFNLTHMQTKGNKEGWSKYLEVEAGNLKCSFKSFVFFLTFLILLADGLTYARDGGMSTF